MSGSLAASRVGGSDLSGLLFLPPQMQAESIYLALAEQEKKKKKRWLIMHEHKTAKTSLICLAF